MTTTRRNFFIRAVATLAGDFAVGFAMGTACAWIIQSAALGVFLAFLAWLLAVMAALTLSQQLVHPVVQFALSDHKLDHGLAVAADVLRTGTDIALELWTWSRSHGASLRPGTST